jgi:hypothetical protein
MSMLLCVAFAWISFSLLFMGLVLILLLVAERASNTSQVMIIADEGISDQARLWQDQAWPCDAPGQHARELAGAFDALAELEGTVALAPHDAIASAAGALADRTQHTDAVIIRDPRLMRAGNLRGHDGCG